MALQEQSCYHKLVDMMCCSMAGFRPTSEVAPVTSPFASSREATRGVPAWSERNVITVPVHPTSY